ncbi:IS30 family transposase [Emergencia sp. 1XD21-10]|uniref:IS30 family transposase n=1 Tax=Emergencia sp. 1XD21-10 TaxID=2304569 RepID=UPI00137AE8D5|nr:IS30 family transposase [Emergencia sp. 1XD21-10]NCE98093.1 IS30 family transposase [Emergencia sp. 1XD21-10]
MRKKGEHLTWNDRLVIERMLLKGHSKKMIAEAIGCCPATIYNEIKRATYLHRNSDLTEETRYCPDQAEEKYRAALSRKGVTPKLKKDKALREHIEHKIVEESYSPAAVLMEIKNQNLKFSESVTVNTVYKGIEKGLFPNLTLEQLPDANRRRKKKKKKKVTKAKKASKGTSIEKRPDVVDDREEFGHWEMDSVIGKQTNRKSILALTERKTRYEIIEVLKADTTDEVRKAINRIEKRMGAAFYNVFQTITVDNGSEFADFESMEKALYRKGKRTSVYYCHPHAPHERGSNEVANKMIRRFFPKGMDFDKELEKKNAKEAEDWINNYPRKCLGGKTAAQCYQEELLRQGYG